MSDVDNAASSPSLRMFVLPHGPVPVGSSVEVIVEVVAPADCGWQGCLTLDLGPKRMAELPVALVRGERSVVRHRLTPDVAGRHNVVATAGRTATFELVEAAAVSTRAVPWFGGGWLDPGALSPTKGYGFSPDAQAEDLACMVDTMADVGMGTIVITYVEYTGGFYYPSDIEFFDRDVGHVTQGNHLDWDYVGTVMDVADRRDLRVMLGVGRGGDTPLLWEFEADDWDDRNAEAIELGSRVGAELFSRYGHRQSFGGWYLTHEMNDLARASAYYDPLARALRSHCNAAPVMVAPAGTPIISRDLLAASEVDAFAYQDAVGAGYIPYEYTWDPQRRIETLDEVYAGYSEAHRGSRKQMWADLEVWEMDGSNGYSEAYPPAWDRVQQQLEVASRHVDFVTAYEWSGFMEHDGQRSRRATRAGHQLFAGYRDHATVAREKALGRA